MTKRKRGAAFFFFPMRAINILCLAEEMLPFLFLLDTREAISFLFLCLPFPDPYRAPQPK